MTSRKPPEVSPPPGVEKVSTGVSGLDVVLHGGLPRGAITLLSGGPGSGKTLMGLEFLVRGALSGSPGIVLTFEERDSDLRRYTAAFGWDLPTLEAQNRLRLISARFRPDAVYSGDFDLGGILGILRQKIDEIQAQRILIDAPDIFLRLLDDITKERTELYSLNEWLRDAAMTAILTVKSDDRKNAWSANYDFLEYLADCVIHLDQRVMEQVTTRRLRVAKYRGSGFGRNEYPFAITDRGLWVIPVTQTSLQHRALGESMPTGVEGLDVLLGGGYRRCSCTLISGSSGTGKTTFACLFAVDAVNRGERVLYLNFEESWNALASCMISPGIAMQEAKDSGRLRFVSAMPESQGVEEHLIMAFRIIEEFQPDHLVVDAISACRRMGSSHAAFDYLLRLTGHCKERGITTLLTNLTAAGKVSEITGIDLSSVIDTVILLRNVERDGIYRREIGILKSRGRFHSNRVHGFEITDQGVRIAKKEALNA
jgi:circadian clock protein KaiC